jgi:hypothetical protein
MNGRPSSLPFLPAASARIPVAALLPFPPRRRHPRFVPTALAIAAAVILAAGFSARGQTTNSLSDAELQGRALAQKILESQPAANLTNTGVLQIRRSDAPRTDVPIRSETVVQGNTWSTRYEAKLGAGAGDTTTLIVTHDGTKPNCYLYFDHGTAAPAPAGGQSVSGDQLMTPFAGSDFWLCDLGLEFFHWPQQKVIKKEFHRQCACMVLESTNPNPSANGYSRVVCWIDEESLGIVEAHAYDATGRKLKDFYPKDLEKINGQYQVGSMVMENVHSGSRSVLEFDLHDNPH